MSMNFFDFSDPAHVFFVVFYGTYLLIALAAIVVFYVLQAKGLYAIAKRRGIHHPALAWVPIGNWWIIGCISDKYQYVTNGRIRNRRKTLLWFSAGLFVASILMIVLAVFFVFSLIESPNLAMIVPAIGFYGYYIAYCGLYVVATVFCCIACFDLYRSCNPKTAVLFLVLSIVACPISIFIFIDRNYDSGMPPRRPRVRSVLPESEPEIVDHEADPTAEEEDFA